MALFSGLQPALRRPMLSLYSWGQRRARERGTTLTVTSVRRSRRHQAELYRRYRAGLTKFPALPPGTSDHEVGWAVDMWSPDPRLLEEMGAVWLAAGGRWGGKVDPVHFGGPRVKPRRPRR